MKPRTLILAVLAVLLLAAAAWQLVDRGAADAVHAPAAVVTEAAAPVLPEPVAVAAALPAPVDAQEIPAAEKPAIKRTLLPDGTIIIENKPITLKYADGRVEEKLIRMVGRPVKKKISTLGRLPPAPSGSQPIAGEGATSTTTIEPVGVSDSGTGSSDAPDASGDTPPSDPPKQDG